MSMTVKVRTLSEAFKIVQLQKKQSTRDIAKQTGMNASTVWRTITHPTKASSVAFVRIAKWSGLSFEQITELFEAELNG